MIFWLLQIILILLIHSIWASVLCLSIFPFACRLACLPARPPACLSFCLPAYLPACLPACLHACLPGCLSFCLFVHFPVSQLACQLVCLNVFLYVCLCQPIISVCLPLSVCPSVGTLSFKLQRNKCFKDEVHEAHTVQQLKGFLDWFSLSLRFKYLTLPIGSKNP